MNTFSHGLDSQKQETRELRKLEPRPYLTVFGIIVLFFAIACLLYPFCELIAILGLPSAPCVLIISVGAAFAAICNACFYLFVVWSCTRTVASLVFLLISISGSILLPAGNPILLMLWVFISFGSWYTYFFYLPALYTDQDKPGWLQDIGKYGLLDNNAEVDNQITKFTNALRTGSDVITEEIQESIDAAKKRAEDAIKASEEAARRLHEEAAKKAAEASAAASAAAASAAPARDTSQPQVGMV
jgi:hypothetical protein